MLTTCLQIKRLHLKTGVTYMMWNEIKECRVVVRVGSRAIYFMDLFSLLA
jgi:hypothetical protein